MAHFIKVCIESDRPRSKLVGWDEMLSSLGIYRAEGYRNYRFVVSRVGDVVFCTDTGCMEQALPASWELERFEKLDETVTVTFRPNE